MKLDKIIKKAKEIVDFFYSLIEIIKFLCTIIVPLFGAFVASFNFEDFRTFLINQNILSEDIVELILHNSNGILSVILVISIIYLCFIIIKTGKKKFEAIDTVNSMVYKLHTEFAHRLRDGICYLYLLNERVNEFKMQNNIDAIKEVRARAYDNLLYNLQHFVDLIEKYLSEYTDDTISVCIKVINPGQNNINNADKTAKTLVRSQNTKNSRKRVNENITLGKNTDFKYLCDATNVWYHGVDLKTKYFEHKYENEFNASDWQEKYNSTIVVPIRYLNSNDTTLVNDILGFICIDSKKIRKEWDAVNPHELHYLAIFADLIYIYIKLFRRLFEEG